jgi:predicted dehydrogenase
MKTSGTSVSRRSFFKRATVLSAPLVIPGHILGLNGQTAPSNKITMATFGWGMMGPGNASSFMGIEGCQMVAVCDVDKHNLKVGVDAVNAHYNNTDCKGYHDFREVMARKDIDTINQSLPDNWHSIVSIEAAKNGKDIYGEKPLARTIREQQAIVKAVQKYQRVWQTGSWQRSQANFRKACEIVRSGLIGKVTRVEVGLPSGHNDFAKTGDKMSVSQPPAHLDYDMWIGPSQMEDYIEGRVHKNWRWNYNIGGGQLLDWVGHHVDIAHWGLGMDESGPLEIKPVQVDFPPRSNAWNTATKYRVEATYADGIIMTIAGGHPDIASGTKWIGDKGWVWVDRSGFDCSINEYKKAIKVREKDQIVEKFAPAAIPDDLLKTKLFDSPGHHQDFINCVKSRGKTLTPVEVGHRSAVPGHLALIALMENRTLKWDPVKEEIIGDEAASKLLGREFRAPWTLEQV